MLKQVTRPLRCKVLGYGTGNAKKNRNGKRRYCRTGKAMMSGESSIVI